METGIASLAGLPRKRPRCQDGAILWFAGGEGDYIMQLLGGGKETTLTEADGDGAPSACLEKCCILLLFLSLFLSFFCFFVLTLLEAAEQKKTTSPISGSQVCVEPVQQEEREKDGSSFRMNYLTFEQSDTFCTRRKQVRQRMQLSL